MSSQLDKRSRINPNEEEGRFSKLPDALILHILSFLDDAKDIVKTGVLSKRFEYLWTEVTCLNFYNLDMKCVNNALYFHKLSNLEEISVMDCYSDDKIELGRLIRVLRLANVKDFSLAFNNLDYPLPQHLYSNSSLKKLMLWECDIMTNRFFNWKSLQKLTLADIMLSDDTIKDVLSGCPSLEFLRLLECYNFSRINLTNNKCLSKLHVSAFLDGVVLKITAPNLKSFYLTCVVECPKCKVFEAESLTNCYLEFYRREVPKKYKAVAMLRSLLRGLSHIEVVTVGKWILQVLSFIELKGFSCPMSKTVKCLKLHTPLKVHDIAGIMWLLRELTCLEKLSIEMWDDEPYLSSFPGLKNVCLNDKAYWTSELDLKLKSVHIEDLKADDDLFDDQNHQLLLVKFLLKTAKCLKNMTIAAYGSEHHLLKLNNKLSGLPRSSPHAVVDLIGQQGYFCTLF